MAPQLREFNVNIDRDALAGRVGSVDYQLTCPPVAQSFTVELRSLGSSSPSKDFKMSYSAKITGFKQFNKVNQLAS